MSKYLAKVRSLDDEKLIRYLVWCARYHSVPLSIITEPPVYDREKFEFAVKTVKENLQLKLIRGEE